MEGLRMLTPQIEVDGRALDRRERAAHSVYMCMVGGK